MLEKLQKEIQENANSEKSEIMKRFFKTGKGEYGEKDVFIGLTVPKQREIAKKYSELSLPKIQKLLKSKIHEYRLTGLLILCDKYKKSTEENKANIFNFYLKNIKNINNWDLVDITAPLIVGNFLLNRKKSTLYDLAKSDNLWERRIAIVSTLAFIKKEEFQETLALSEILISDKHHLIHKAVGWMLREVGKRNKEVLEHFLKDHYNSMPRTMLRYAIERFEEDKRKKYLLGEIK